jgi:hypothetical protein
MQMRHSHFALRLRSRFDTASPSSDENNTLGLECGDFWLSLHAASESGSLCY